MCRTESSRKTMVVNEEDNNQDNQLPPIVLNMKDTVWPSRSKEMKELLLNKEMKELKIERAEHKRRIEQLEDQNDDLLLELASLRMNQSVSSVRSTAGTGLYDGGGSENSMNETSFSVITNTTANTKSNSNSNAAIPRRNSDAITFTRCSPHAANRRVTVGVTTPKAVKSCLSRTSSTLRRGSSMTSTSRRGSRRVTIASSSPYSTNSGGSGGSGGSGSTNSTSSSRTARRRISSSSKDLLRICKGMALLQDDDDDDEDDEVH
ncbi:hypothetical protein FRACYDRAFT_244292 [Fragilariopsis cylindrus CCMP1102]|uniref:Uncharacterized protein n=1 Tax=Fragilariopsis cylindrus CCMP1102 TaxID=635003 RepID=A0A1E7F1R1_9STRA|nr:hypothetical protein FRACYDRAFT_244292 [Fragilariopsis cylindrus CCMP1102]|eukprot:OEU12067.1 hypothetical protein FRACYDRAFT_244292 [Fragilariopsis cylindrus CCMP1102]